MINEYEIGLKNKEILSAFLKIYKSGAEIKLLEGYFSELFGKEALGVGSGSDAIFIILKEIKNKFGTGEIICSDYSCKSIPRAIIEAGFKPVFVDVDESLSLDISLVKKAISKETKAILIYHPWGFPHKQNIFEYCRKNKILCIEDCAKGWGFYENKKRMGSLGDYSFFSFRTGKLLHSGSGSIIISKDKIMIPLKKYPKFLSLFNFVDLFLRKLANFARPKAVFDYLFDKIGAIKIGNAEAYLTLKQVSSIKGIEEKRIKNYHRISKTLDKAKFKMIEFNKGRVIPLSFPLLVDKRKEFSRLFKRCGVDARAYYTHTNSSEFDNYKSFLNGNSVKISEKIINIPIHEKLKESEVEKIVKVIQNANN